MFGESNISKMYGNLELRHYDVFENSIDAFYDNKGNLVCVLDKLIDNNKPNVLLVINPDGEKKWDEILSNNYNVNLETIRPKFDNKYAKLDIEYSGLDIYNDLINAFINEKSVDNILKQLAVLRNSVVRNSSMTRLTAANEIIAKANDTIVKTQNSITRIESDLKKLRSKLIVQKKEIGREPTKQSASKILRTEAQVEITNEKLKRAKKRLLNAQHRLEIAVSDAETASEFLNRPLISANDDVDIMRVSEDESTKNDILFNEQIDNVMENSDEYKEIKPLFEEDPKILDENIAFKPVDFSAPVLQMPEKLLSADIEQQPTVTDDNIINDEVDMPENIVEKEEYHNTEEQKETNIDKNLSPVLDAIRPVVIEEHQEIEKLQTFSPVLENNLVTEGDTDNVNGDVIEEQQDMIRTEENESKNESTHNKTSIFYYVLLLILICLSVFTLWLYQTNIQTNKPILTSPVTETKILDTSSDNNIETINIPVVEDTETTENIEDVFVDDQKSVSDIEKQNNIGFSVENSNQDTTLDKGVESLQSDSVVVEETSVHNTLNNTVVNKPEYDVEDKVIINTENVSNENSLPDTDHNSEENMFLDEEAYYEE